MRLFIALEIPPTVRQEVEAKIDGVRSQGPRARWIPARNLHLTLSFLGEQSAACVPDLEEALTPVFERHPPMTLRLCDGGAFPSRRGARVLWVGVEARDGDLAALYGEVQATSATVLGAKPERRPWNAHVTVARCRPPWPPQAVERFVEHLSGYLGDEFTVGQGTLFESRLEPAGARYHGCLNFPLRRT